MTVHRNWYQWLVNMTPCLPRNKDYPRLAEALLFLRPTLLHRVVKVKVKVKVKFTLEQATKAQRGSRSIAILFL